MTDLPRYRASVIELPAFADVLTYLLDAAMPGNAQARALVVGASWAVMTLSPEGVRIFRPADVAEVEKLLHVLHAEALPDFLRIDLTCAPETAERIMRFAATLPGRAAARLQ